MSMIISYREGEYSQIKLDSGERILFSVASSGIVIFRLSFFGLIPREKIAEWLPKDLARFMLFFGGAPLSQTPFNNTVRQLSSFDSIRSLRQFLSRDINSLELIRQEKGLEKLRGEH